MGAQERTEKVLRDIHVLFSKAEPYQGSSIHVVIDKSEMMELLKELNSCMYDMMDEHELSAQKRDKVNREMKKQGDDIIFEATRKAEDVYAASIMYTDNALHRIQDIMKETNRSLEEIYQETRDRISKEQQIVRRNQSELKSQLEEFIDTQKYLHLIEEENHRQQLENGKEESRGYSGSRETSPYAGLQPEIKINKDYFIQNGIPLEEEEEQSDVRSQEQSEEEQEALARELDEEYFAWKEEEDAEKEEESSEKEKKGFSLFSKIIDKT